MEKTLSVFVDESGRFQHPDRDSRFYIVGMVFHDQSADITNAGDQLTDSEYRFFGGRSAFRRNEAKFLALHSI